MKHLFDEPDKKILNCPLHGFPGQEVRYHGGEWAIVRFRCLKDGIWHLEANDDIYETALNKWNEAVKKFEESK